MGVASDICHNVLIFLLHFLSRIWMRNPGFSVLAPVDVNKKLNSRNVTLLKIELSASHVVKNQKI